ncbi:unnamed protein product [Phytophthora lilii]|uniref:Unnamed protein product n=1 Tax=Phytophthora lilii TaxID=2077276 RepID=A0A9W6TF96_9STRA|nr:unnamed protein product [Phytophthora lilii]
MALSFGDDNLDAKALLAAQAIAHEDFEQAAAQVQRVLQYQRPDGLLPHLVYGPSVPSGWRWIPSNRTFHPGPAFWRRPELHELKASSPLNTSTISAPPVAADVVWEIFRLAPYDSVLGVRTNAVQFLCSVYEPLKKLQKHLFSTRSGPAPNGLLSARTFSSLSPHWKQFLAEIKNAPDYDTVIRTIPEEARARFAVGAASVFTAEDAVENVYEPMMYLAAHGGQSSDTYSRESIKLSSDIYTGDGSEAAQFGVEDVEFNALILRSSLGLVNIGRVLIEHSSVCTGFTVTQKELLNDMEELHSMSKGLEGALIGSNSTQGLWNVSADFFADSSRLSLTAVHSLRGFLPAYAAELDDDKKMRSMKHFLSEPGSFSFFCTQFPASFFASSGDDSSEIAGWKDGHATTTTWMLYNYFLQRGLSRTKDMVCKSTPPGRTSLSWFPFSLTMEEPTPTPLALAYNSHDATPVDVFDDSYVGSTLAAAVLLNVLLPADTRLSPTSAARRRSSAGAGAKKPRDKLDRRRDDLEDRGRSSASGSSWADRYSESSYSDYSPRSGHTPYELEESLISEEDEHYGSFDEAEEQESPSNSAWKAAKNALAAISPW